MTGPRGAKAAAAAGEGDQNASRQEPHQSRAMPCSSRPHLRNSRQHPLHHRPQRAVTPGKALRPDPQQHLEVALDEPVERRLARPPRLVDPARDLPTQREACSNFQTVPQLSLPLAATEARLVRIDRVLSWVQVRIECAEVGYRGRLFLGSNPT